MRVISLSSLVCLIPLSIVVVMESVPETVKERVFAFGESDFLVENFNPEQFLAKYSTTCELEDLKSDITEFLQHCENAIMSIMNKDYESFISLAMRLNGLKEKISAIRTPLSESEGQLKIHKENLIRECEALASLLKRYRDVEERKHYLQQFMDLNSLLEEAEGIVNEVRYLIGYDIEGKAEESDSDASRGYYEYGTKLQRYLPRFLDLIIVFKKYKCCCILRDRGRSFLDYE